MFLSDDEDEPPSPNSAIFYLQNDKNVTYPQELIMLPFYFSQIRNI